jgi:hypothetical protein
MEARVCIRGEGLSGILISASLTVNSAANCQYNTGTFSPSGRLTQTWYPAEYTTQVAMSDMGFHPNTTTGNPGRGHGARVFNSFFSLSAGVAALPYVRSNRLPLGFPPLPFERKSCRKTEGIDSTPKHPSSHLVPANRMLHLNWHGQHHHLLHTCLILGRPKMTIILGE